MRLHKVALEVAEALPLVLLLLLQQPQQQQQQLALTVHWEQLPRRQSNRIS